MLEIKHVIMLSIPAMLFIAAPLDIIISRLIDRAKRKRKGA